MIAPAPGPWTLDAIGIVRDATGAPVQTAGPDCLNDDGAAYANARLIAAAPELYEVLKEIIEGSDWSVATRNRLLELATEALAKVEGP